MTYRNGVLLVLSAVSLVAAGCSPVSTAKRGLQEVRGAQAQISVIQPIPAADLATYSGVRVNQVVSGIGHLAPQSFVTALRAGLATELGKVEGFRATGSPLLLNAEVTFYKMGSAADALMGKEKMVIMHVVVSRAEGAKVGQLLAVVSTEAMRTGEQEIADALAKGVADYFEARLPKREGD